MACRADQACISAQCGCKVGDVDCDGTCVNPNTNPKFCGANSECAAFTRCEAGAVCTAGQCASTASYAGSLAMANGRWNYQGQIGLAGAHAACTATFGATGKVCTLAELTTAARAGQLKNATAEGHTVDSFWIDAEDIPGTCDKVGPDGGGHPGCRRCQDFTQENVPWSYATAHIGVLGNYVALDNQAGTIGPMQFAECALQRNVPCCGSTNVK
jgi:hypothetical protein